MALLPVLLLENIKKYKSKTVELVINTYYYVTKE